MIGAHQIVSGVWARKPVQCLPTTTHAIPTSSRSRSTAVPALSNSTHLSLIVAQGIASDLQYRIAVAEGTHASLARSIKMWQVELELLEVRAGPSTSSDVVLVEGLLEAEDSDMSVSGNFVPDEYNSLEVSVV